MTKKKNISKKQNKVVCKRIEPSLLSIIKKSNKEAVTILKFIKKLGLKYVHYDVMDGKFVPNTALNTQFLKEIKKLGLKDNKKKTFWSQWLFKYYKKKYLYA